jgi:hypothetical protein
MICFSLFLTFFELLLNARHNRRIIPTRNAGLSKRVLGCTKVVRRGEWSAFFDQAQMRSNMKLVFDPNAIDYGWKGTSSGLRPPSPARRLEKGLD